MTQLMTSLQKQRDELDCELPSSSEKQSEDQKISSEDLNVKNEDSTINVIKNILKLARYHHLVTILYKEAPL